MTRYYVAREQAGDGTLWQVYDDADGPVRPHGLPMAWNAAVAAQKKLSAAAEDRAYAAASPYERERMRDTSGT